MKTSSLSPAKFPDLRRLTIPVVILAGCLCLTASILRAMDGNFGNVTAAGNVSIAGNLTVTTDNGLTVLTDGDVGIGTATPSYTLTVGGSNTLTVDAGNGLVGIGTTPVSGTRLTVAGGTVLGDDLLVDGFAAFAGATMVEDGFGFVVDTSVKFDTAFYVLGSPGYVGIDLASPDYPLDVAGDVRLSGNVITGVFSDHSLGNFTVGNLSIGAQPLLVLGNGNTTTATSNAFAVLHNGNTTISGNLAIGGVVTGNVTYARRQGDIIMGTYGNGGGD